MTEVWLFCVEPLVVWVLYKKERNFLQEIPWWGVFTKRLRVWLELISFYDFYFFGEEDFAGAVAGIGSGS